MRAIDAYKLMWEAHFCQETTDAFVELIDKQPTIGGWVSVKDRLPPMGERVLVFAVGKEMYGHGGETIRLISEMSDKNWLDYHLKTEPYWIPPFQFFLSDYEITHWMPLPEMPEE